jgi:hypothetical protein
MSDNEQDIIYQTALKEFESGQLNAFLWQRALDQCANDAGKAKKIYLDMRMKAMQESVKDHVKVEIKKEIAKLAARPADFLNAKDLLKKR